MANSFYYQNELAKVNNFFDIAKFSSRQLSCIGVNMLWERLFYSYIILHFYEPVAKYDPLFL